MASICHLGRAIFHRESGFSTLLVCYEITRRLREQRPPPSLASFQTSLVHSSDLYFLLTLVLLGSQCFDGYFSLKPFLQKNHFSMTLFIELMPFASVKEGIFAYRSISLYDTNPQSCSIYAYLALCVMRQFPRKGPGTGVYVLRSIHLVMVCLVPLRLKVVFSFLTLYLTLLSGFC